MTTLARIEPALPPILRQTLRVQSRLVRKAPGVLAGPLGRVHGRIRLAEQRHRQIQVGRQLRLVERDTDAGGWFPGYPVPVSARPSGPERRSAKL